MYRRWRPLSRHRDSYRLAEELDQEAQAAGVMLLPGSGGSVAMRGSLAGPAALRVKAPIKLSIALHVAGGFSRGSAVSASENVTIEKTLHRIDGKLVSRSAEDVRAFDFGNGPATSFPVTLPELIMIWRATDIANIETFVHVIEGAFPEGDIAAIADGPTVEQRKANRYHAAVEVTAEDGTVVRSILDTVNGYTFTAIAAAKAAQPIVGGEALPGFRHL